MRWLLVNGLSVTPSYKNTTGIGPVIDRQRAARTGTDVVVAHGNTVVPPFDAPLPSKTPRRCARCALMRVGGLLSARDAVPASTCFTLRVEFNVGSPAGALYVLTRFCSRRLLGET
ncbi:MAG: hypothetical protein M3R16_06990 [Pseudomonadota bacterium]|nr:hypothetical protein [Pseudomonadota bacterium]